AHQMDRTLSKGRAGRLGREAGQARARAGRELQTFARAAHAYAQAKARGDRQGMRQRASAMVGAAEDALKQAQLHAIKHDELEGLLLSEIDERAGGPAAAAPGRPFAAPGVPSADRRGEPLAAGPTPFRAYLADCQM